MKIKLAKLLLEENTAEPSRENCLNYDTVFFAPLFWGPFFILFLFGGKILMFKKGGNFNEKNRGENRQYFRELIGRFLQFFGNFIRWKWQQKSTENPSNPSIDFPLFDLPIDPQPIHPQITKLPNKS
jgi:hypothetical protein